jgi:uncharacterized Zn-binding protein involved in type VI secretion
MRRAIRKGVDKSTGHCYTPRPCVTGSNNVFINKIPATRVGDFYPTHCCGSSCHSGNATSTSNVFVNNRPIHRSGDPITCGDTAFNGSPNVFIN